MRNPEHEPKEAPGTCLLVPDRVLVSQIKTGSKSNQSRHKYLCAESPGVQNISQQEKPTPASDERICMVLETGVECEPRK